MYSLALLETHESDALAAHCARHWDENRADRFMVDAPIDLVFGAFTPPQWAAPTSDPGWQRVWALRGHRGIMGHISLTGNLAAPHRCTLGMGIERVARRQGWGRRMMRVALGFAFHHTAVDWVDGYALANNHAVLELDRSVGFCEVARVEDVARFGDARIAQVILTRKVER